MKDFYNAFKATGTSEKVSEEIIKEYKEKVPSLLIDIWKEHGFTKYNQGLIELINPKDYEESLSTWLGRKVDNYVPFAITAFGELIYYRKLTETDEDVCMIDMQYRKIENLIWGLDLFFEDFLLDNEERKEWLREDLFNSAIKEEGELQRNEAFTFTPILAMGGATETKYLEKGNAQVYQDIVFQMTS